MELKKKMTMENFAFFNIYNCKLGYSFLNELFLYKKSKILIIFYFLISNIFTLLSSIVHI